MDSTDIVERFQLALLLSVIALRNLIEISGSTFAMLPASYIPLSVIPSFSALQSIISPAAIVLMSEMLVDWLKHAFITKFNHIRPQVYGRFIDVLCKDLLVENQFSTGQVRSRFIRSWLEPTPAQAFVDQSPAVSRRIGLAALPLGCLVVRVVYQALIMLTDTSHIDECAPSTFKPATTWRFGMPPQSGRVEEVGRAWQAMSVRWSIVTLVGFAVWSGCVATAVA